MDAGLLRALQTVKNNRYVQYVGLGLTGLVKQQEQTDQETGKRLRKSKYQLIRISAAVCGIELCYAAETAFVSPILLKLGVPTNLMTLVWCLSPIVGFFLVPVMGSLSDRCRLKIGRRRPFIIVLSIGIILGLALVPNGKDFGILLGDTWEKWNDTLFENATYYSTSVVNTLNSSGAVTLSNNKTIPSYFESTSGMEKDDRSRVGDDSTINANSTLGQDVGFPYAVHKGHLRGIVLTILGVAMLDFNCDACQSPCRAYLLDVSVPEDHSQGLTMFTVMAGAGGAVGYVMGGIDWNSTSFGEAFGGHFRVVFTLVLVAFIVCVTSTLTSFKETPLSDLDISEEQLQRKKKKKDNKKYKKFTNEEDSSSDDEHFTRKVNYGAIVETDKSDSKNGIPNAKWELISDIPSNSKMSQNSILSTGDNTSDKEVKTTHNFGQNKAQENAAFLDRLSSSDLGKNMSQNSPTTDRQFSLENSQSADKFPHINGHIKESNHMSHSFHQSLTKSTSSNEISPYTMRSGLSKKNDKLPKIDALEISTDVSLKTYLRSIVRMPRCLWILCLTNLFCWMSLVCYSLYFTDFVGQAVFQGNPQAPVGSLEHNLYDQGVRLGSMGMSLYSLSCACYSLSIEKLVQRFRAKRVYVLGQLVYTVGMLVMAASRSKVVVILMSPTAGVMYATLFTMPYLVVAHYHARGMFSQADVVSGDEYQVRGLGTDVAIISSMVFLAQFLLSVFMGTAISVIGSTTTVVVASSVLSFLGAITATQITYLDL